MKYLVSDYEVLHRSRIKYSTVFVLPINYLSESSNVYQSDNQIGNYTYINSPIDYSKGQLCPIFCVYKSGSYVNKCLKINNLKEFVRPPNMTLYNAIYTLITAFGNTQKLPNHAKSITYLPNNYHFNNNLKVIQTDNQQVTKCITSNLTEEKGVIL